MQNQSKNFESVQHIAEKLGESRFWLRKFIDVIKAPIAFELDGKAYLTDEAAGLVGMAVGALDAGDFGLIASIKTQLANVAQSPTIAVMIQAAAPAADMLLAGGAPTIEAAQGDTKPPRITMQAYNGGLLAITGWGSVGIELSGLELPKSCPVLVDHNSSLSAVAGSVTPEVRAGVLFASGTLAAGTAPAEQILALSRAAMPLQCSVGVMPITTRRVEAGQSFTLNGQTLKAQQPVTIAVKSILREISVVGVGADGSTSVAVSAAARGNDTMNTNTNTGAPAITASANLSPELDPIVAAERARVSEISKRLARYPGSGVILARAIEENMSPDAAELLAIRSNRPAPASVVSSGRGSVIDRELIAAALTVRFIGEKPAERIFRPDVLERSRPLHNAHMMDIVEACLQADGIMAPQGREEMVRAAFSSLSLPNALGDSLHRTVEQAYLESPATWRAIVSVRNVSDFRDAKAIRISFGGAVEEVAATGEFKHSDVSEDFYTSFRADTFGKLIRFTRKDIINDDAGALADAGQVMARMCMRGVSDLIWSTVMGNVGSWFSSGHKNYLSGADSNLNVANLGSAAQKMLVQRDKSGNDLDIQPATLVVPPSLGDTARGILSSEWLWMPSDTAASTPSANAQKNRVSLAIEPRLENDKFTGYSALAWYLFAAPINSPVIACFLNGKQTPTVEFFGLDSDPNRLGYSYRVYLDYGAALHEYRAAVKSKGEA